MMKVTLEIGASVIIFRKDNWRTTLAMDAIESVEVAPGTKEKCTVSICTFNNIHRYDMSIDDAKRLEEQFMVMQLRAR